jgi:hypothetical protein
MAKMVRLRRIMIVVDGDEQLEIGKGMLAKLLALSTEQVVGRPELHSQRDEVVEVARVDVCDHCQRPMRWVQVELQQVQRAQESAAGLLLGQEQASDQDARSRDLRVMNM